MYRAYKYRIYPNNKQKTLIEKTFSVVNFVYNYYLDYKNKLYKEEGKIFSKIDCNNHCNRVLKNEYEWIREVDKFAVTNAIFNVNVAFINWIKHGRSFPHYKKDAKRCSYKTDFTPNNIEVDFANNKIKLPKLSWVECKVDRKFEGKIKSATISKTYTGKYYVSVLVDTEIEKKPYVDGIYSFDLGIKDFLIDNKGNFITPPKPLCKYEKKIARLQRRLSKKQKGSKRSEKQRLRIAKLHEKVNNIRKDFLHKLSTKIINENQIIISEDLNVKGMLKNRLLAKHISDVSWGQFCLFLEYKAKWYGRTYHKINKFYASSQTCSVCGYKNEDIKKLSIRSWVCEKCGTEHSRDINAAVNIMNKGLEELGILNQLS
jgi:putative transposase